jgi:heme oxygenase
LHALRSATAAAHRRLHHVTSFAALLRGRLSLDEYKTLLLRLLGLHAPLDERQQFFRNEPLLSWMRCAPGQSRTVRLRRDLAVLGVPDDVTRQVARADVLLPPLSTAAEALGCAWVVEGSALGGRIMAKLLSDQFGIGPESGGAFFAPLPQQDVLWSACCAAVERCRWQQDERANMLAGARDTMNAFADWMDVEPAI